MGAKNAQAWGFDLVVGIMIFLGGIVLFFLYILNFPTERNEVFATLGYEGDLIGDSLLSNGYPSNWDVGNVAAVGILSDGKVNNTKLERFYNLAVNDYTRTKRLFNVVNEYYVSFSEPVMINGTPVVGIGQQGADRENLVKVTRVIVHDNKIKNLNINMWN